MARVRFRSLDRRRSHVQPSTGKSAAPSPDITPISVPTEGDVQTPHSLFEVPKPAEGIGPKPASDLALDLVLNEIVLQARLTTTATGGLIALQRSDELICRATTGAMAMDVASCLKLRSGIAANCFHSGAVGRADDIGSDLQADSVAYRRSGVRSILVVPVQSDPVPGEKEQRHGILQIFSPRANAFCDRDVVTLQALARRVAMNIELVQKSYPAPHTRPQLKVPSPGPEQISNANANPKPRASGVKLLASRRRLRKKFGSIHWMAILEKTVFALVFLAVGCGLFRIATIQRTNYQSHSKASVQPRPVPPPGTQQQTAAVAVDSDQRASRGLSNPNPASWPDRSSRGVVASSSITVLRVPVHKPVAQSVEEEKSSAVESNPHESQPGDLVLFESHKPISGGRTSRQISSKDPAAEVLPSATANPGSTHSKIEVIPTQAAMGRLVQRIEPEYPNAARQQHIQGTVLLDVIVNTDGAVDGLSLISGESQLMAAAAEAVRQWHFQPLIKNGQPRKFESRIAIDFTLAADASLPDAKDGKH